MKIKYKNTQLTVTKLISANTASGIVYNTSNTKFVVKFIILRDQSDVSEFMMEKTIGSKINPNHGATIRFASLIEPYDITIPLLKNKNPRNDVVGYLIMDNLVQKKNEFSLSLQEYLYYFEYIMKSCPSKTHPLYKLLRDSLKHLYSIGYYHGDLHDKNIYVIVDKSYKIKYVKIIDFGRSQPFKKKANSSCIVSSLKQVKQEFKNAKSKYAPTKYKTNVKYNIKGNPFRSNNNMLKVLPNIFRYNYFASIPR